MHCLLRQKVYAFEIPAVPIDLMMWAALWYSLKQAISKELSVFACILIKSNQWPCCLKV